MLIPIIKKFRENQKQKEQNNKDFKEQNIKVLQEKVTKAIDEGHTEILCEYGETSTAEKFFKTDYLTYHNDKLMRAFVMTEKEIIKLFKNKY